MKLKVFSIILFSVSVFGQDNIKFNVLIDDKSIDDKKNQSFNIYNSESGLIGSEKVGVIFETILSKYPTTLYFYIEGFPLEELTVNKASDEIITVFIGKADQLNEVVLKAQKKKVFKLGRLNDFEGTSIYAGKKMEIRLCILFKI